MSLRSKFVLCFILLVTLMMTSVLYITVSRERQSFEKQIREKYLASCKTLAISSVDALLTKDFSLLREYVNEVAKDKNIIYAIIVDESGQIVTHTNHKLQGKFFYDPVSIRASRTKEPIWQKYSRDDGEFLWDIAVPIGSFLLPRNFSAI